MNIRFFSFVSSVIFYALAHGSFHKNMHDDVLVPSMQAAAGMGVYLPFNSLANQLAQRSFGYESGLSGGSVSLSSLYKGYARITAGFAASTVVQTAVNNHLKSYIDTVSGHGDVLEPLIPCIAGVVSAPLSAGWEAYAAHVGFSRPVRWPHIARLTLAPIALREAIFSYSYLYAAQKTRLLVQDLGIQSPLGAAVIGGGMAGVLGAVVSQPISEVARLVQNSRQPLTAAQAFLMLAMRVKNAQSLMPLYQTALPRTVGMIGAVAAMEVAHSKLNRLNY